MAYTTQARQQTTARLQAKQARMLRPKVRGAGKVVAMPISKKAKAEQEAATLAMFLFM